MRTLERVSAAPTRVLASLYPERSTVVVAPMVIAFQNPGVYGANRPAASQNLAHFSESFNPKVRLAAPRACVDCSLVACFWFPNHLYALTETYPLCGSRALRLLPPPRPDRHTHSINVLLSSPK